MNSTHLGARDYYLHVAIGALVTALQYLQLPAGRRPHARVTARDVRLAHAQLVQAEVAAEAAWAARVAARVAAEVVS